MAATLQKALPYLFVHEADEKKGEIEEFETGVLATFAALKAKMAELKVTCAFDAVAGAMPPSP